MPTINKGHLVTVGLTLTALALIKKFAPLSVKKHF